MKFVLPLSLLFLTATFVVSAQDDSVKQAELISVPSVKYPQEAMSTGLEGKVQVRLRVKKDGSASPIDEPAGPGWVCSNSKRTDVLAMRDLAKNAASRATFRPATKDSKPIDGEMVLTFDFKDLSGKAKKMGGLSTAARVVDPSEMRLDPPPADDGKLKVVPGGVLTGQAIELARPEYPAAARAVRAGGSVNVQSLIDTDGRVLIAEPIAGHPLLRSASRIAACQSRFKPTLLSGIPVMVSGIITYNFVP